MSFEKIYHKGKEVELDKSASSGRLYVGIDEDGNLNEKWLNYNQISPKSQPVPQVPKGFTGWVDSVGNIIQVEEKDAASNLHSITERVLKSDKWDNMV